ncbi:MAG TPA: ribosome small subunit-dependent GTPase A, partial [Anaerolineales bacterium]|nr:ribosome small subunit-dependent GTPase A [Anaerolineales bacterium]
TMTINNKGDVGVVFRKTLGHYTVHANGRDIDCVLSSLIHKQLIFPTADPTSLRHTVQEVREIDHVDPVAIGDRVRYIDTGEGRGVTPLASTNSRQASGVIVEILPRDSKLSRPAPVPGARVFEQVIVANADLVLPVFSVANPTPKWGLLDRYLVSAEAAELPSLIVINKLDLAWKNPGFDEEIEVYRRIGYPVLQVSAATGEGIEELKQALQGKLSVLVGKSGVGKTSLLNAIQPGLGQRVRAVSQGELGKGRHTTTHLEMFSLDFGGRLVDTPGIREFGLWDIAGEELAYLFPEMDDFVGRCKFGLSCRHDREPGCAVRKAVVAGSISPYRYQSYMRLREEL